MCGQMGVGVGSSGGGGGGQRQCQRCLALNFPSTALPSPRRCCSRAPRPCRRSRTRTAARLAPTLTPRAAPPRSSACSACRRRALTAASPSPSRTSAASWRPGADARCWGRRGLCTSCQQPAGSAGCAQGPSMPAHPLACSRRQIRMWFEHDSDVVMPVAEVHLVLDWLVSLLRARTIEGRWAAAAGAARGAARRPTQRQRLRAHCGPSPSPHPAAAACSRSWTSPTWWPA